ncbi:hypothetical protein AB0M32_03805 [Streptomyces sp. NPDC051985]|uniref:hypothetical protein n=1 Tax=Streptomyces sp. NPDC051985 TaxID=3155807 RepID=UPI00341EBDB3
MTGTDPYRFASPPPPPPAADPARGADLTRTLLWSLLVLSAAANMATSYGDVTPWANVACGAVTLLSAGALVVRRLRGRR